jgi:voltage-gated potassium channel
MLKKIRSQVMIAVSSILILIGIGTIGYRLIEGWSWIRSFYFSVITITTVGYGDMHPTSDLSRIFTAFYILIGVTIALGSIGIIGSNYISRREERLMKKKLEKEQRSK